MVAVTVTTEAFPLSPRQRRLVGAEGATSGAARMAVRLDGHLDEERLRAAVAAAVERHEILRTVFERPVGVKVPYQVVRDEAGVAWEDVRVDGPAGRVSPEAVAGTLLDRLAEPPFDLARGPLLRCAVHSIDDETHLWLVTAPALVLDRPSLTRLAEEVAAVYGGEEVPEPAQYVDVAQWHEELLEADDETAREARRFWARQSADRASRESAAGSDGFEPESAPIELEPEILAGLERLAEARGLPTAALVLATWRLLLGRLGLVGSSLHVGFDGRADEDLEGVLGPLERWLPLRLEVGPVTSLPELAADTSRLLDEGRAAQDYADLDEEGATGVFASGDLPDPREEAGLGFTLLYARAFPRSFLLFLGLWRRDGEIELELAWDRGRIEEEEARGLAARFAALATELLERPDAPAAALGLLSAEDRRRVERDAAPAAVRPEAEPIHRRTAGWAERDRKRQAVAFEERSLSYGELAARARGLAARLHLAGIGPEDRVGICLDRSEELAVAIVGTLEAGAAFVPLDPQQPTERLVGMAEEAALGALVLERGTLPEGALPDVPRLALGDVEAEAGEGFVPIEVDLDSLAYVLFTSGSTGRPKGVEISHRALAAYVDGIVERYGLGPGSSYATVSTFAADLGHTAIFTALATGGCLHIVAAERATSPERFAEYLADREVDVLKIVPSHLEALLAAARPERALPRRLLVLGGETFAWELAEKLRRLAPGLAVVNHYGPTETTVGVLTSSAVGERSPRVVSVPLGRPLPGVRTLVVGADGRPTPPGMEGELWIGGPQVARGYRDRPGETAVRFVPDPLAAEVGGRFYRTGDLVRRLTSDEYEFRGRADHQIKLRGYRIEPGEVEAALRREAGVREAVVQLEREPSGAPRLVGYLASGDPDAVDPEPLRERLGESLPDYMVPSRLIVLERLPLTPNGKVDRARLSELAADGEREVERYVAPHTEAERTLAEIWADLLKRERVGAGDNFFALGGDSILAIQMTARANQAGLALGPTQIFEHQTVSELAAAVGTGPEIDAEQGPVVGEAPLTPIQRWFFERSPAQPHHWNQSLLLRVEAGWLEPELLERALEAVLLHHDALRLRIETGEDGELRQRFEVPEEAPAALAVVDLEPVADPGGEIARLSAGIQARLDFERGPIVSAVLFRHGPEGEDRLLLVAHHLAIDAVSWRLILEDLEAVYEQLRRDEDFRLPAKTTSFKRWAERLEAHVRRGEVDDQIDFWTALAAEPSEPLPVDHPGGGNRMGSLASVAGILDRERTEALLEKVGKAYNTHVDEVLLAALLAAVARWYGASALTVDLESHGREAPFDDVDLSRTVGWFTVHYPLRLAAPPEAGPGERLRAVKEQVRRASGRGSGYGLLRYLRGDAALAERLAPLGRTDVSFNYLGQLDRALDEEARFVPAPESAGPRRSPEGERRHLVDITAGVFGRRLEVRWAYGRELFDAATIEAAKEAYLASLAELVDHCLAVEPGQATASDFPLAGLDSASFEQLAATLDEGDEDEETEAAPG